MKIYKTYWEEKWTKANKNGMSEKYYRFKKHYFKKLKDAKKAASELSSAKRDYYAILKVLKDDQKVFTFVLSDCNGSIMRPSDLEGLHILKYVGSSVFWA